MAQEPTPCDADATGIEQSRELRLTFLAPSGRLAAPAWSRYAKLSRELLDT